MLCFLLPTQPGASETVPKPSRNRPETARVQNRYLSKGFHWKIVDFSIPGRSRPGPALLLAELRTTDLAVWSEVHKVESPVWGELQTTASLGLLLSSLCSGAWALCLAMFSGTTCRAW